LRTAVPGCKQGHAMCSRNSLGWSFQKHLSHLSPVYQKSFFLKSNFVSSHFCWRCRVTGTALTHGARAEVYT